LSRNVYLKRDQQRKYRKTKKDQKNRNNKSGFRTSQKINYEGEQKREWKKATEKKAASVEVG